MRRSVLGLSLSLSVALFAACDEEVIVTGAQVPTAAPVLPIAVAVGVPSGPANPGYAITANVGGSYRLVWSSDSADRIAGSIFTPGRFTLINPGCGGECAVASSDLISRPIPLSLGGERIDIDAIATTTDVGLDFVVDLEPVFFDLFVNGARIPELVRFPSADLGGTPATPISIPFGLTGTGILQ
jgi:hypothetical protein